MNCTQAADARLMLAVHCIACNQVHVDKGSGECTVVVEPGTFTLHTLAEAYAFIAGTKYNDGAGCIGDDYSLGSV